jgi:signal transduction histidine kinase
MRGRLFRGVVVVGPDDAALAEAGDTSDWARAAAAAVASARLQRRPRVGDLRAAGAGRRIAVAVPLKETGAGTPVVAVGLLAPGDAPLAAMVRPALGAAELVAELADGAGHPLARLSTSARAAPAAASDLGAPRSPPEAQALGAGRAWVGLARLDGGEELVAVAPLTFAPWSVVLREDATQGLAPTRTLRRRLVVTSTLVVLIALLFAHGAARSVIDPLAVLTRSAERVAAGEIDRPVPPLPDDEVGRLGRALESMRSALEASLGAARRANAELERRVEERTRQIASLNRELQDKDAARTRLLAKVIGAQEDERRRIARELHDDTCQTLAAILLRLDAGAEPAAAIAAARPLAAHAVEGVHRLIFDLRPSVLDDLGLVPAIRWYADRHLASRGIAVRCEHEGPEVRLPAEVETAVFRAAQEALANVARHAGAENVLVQIADEGSALVVEIEDDGAGFDPEEVAQAAPSGRGLGLLGIRERLELVGGTARIESRPGDGTRVVLHVPVPVREPEASHA